VRKKRKTLDKALIKKQILLINEKHKEDTRVLRQDCLSYNSVFTSKVGDSLLYIQNCRSTFYFFGGTRAFLEVKNAVRHSDST